MNDGGWQMFSDLLHAGADPDAVDNYGNTVLDYVEYSDILRRVKGL